ncbi:putative class III chitinase [Aspergillus novofumigatus IBT 16806]|uniref:chitinase n=1 Tax=Aspergillus novofumigatus (strain IBT 16806) TaxID=1392255 RepID=A0A2I1BZC0_ASPN1|nr:putative glycosyl hydrolase, family 18 [Aspergillus novofumigatus IBT 16806]PKX90718.1 putative glycosyl hydrolase, family 18 [Aspergillus novofumigatus IBT 16806]
MALYKLGIWASLLATFHTASAKLNLNSPSNIAIYWGQNSHGASTGLVAQQRLSYYCQNADFDVFQLAFVTRINGANGLPEVNFANAGDNCTTFEGTNLLSCPQIEEDIPICQSLGKTILLSIGGATYTEGGFTSESAAIAGANKIWQTFGPPTNTSTLRPFGKATIDGFDFDFESTVSNMPTFANQLRSLFSSDPSKQYYLTAAPQCPYPDAADGPMLNGAVSFDAIWVQFYNNYCGLQAYDAGSTTQNNFNFATWDTWAKSVSLNKNVKVFLGVPGSSTAAGSGYVSVDTLAKIVAYTKGFSSFGGVMAWDASQVKANTGFLQGVRAALGSGSGSSSTHDECPDDLDECDHDYDFDVDEQHDE